MINAATARILLITYTFYFVFLIFLFFKFFFTPFINLLWKDFENHHSLVNGSLMHHLHLKWLTDQVCEVHERQGLDGNSPDQDQEQQQVLSGLTLSG